MKLDTDCEIVFFVSSSGHCTLTCPYCIIDPVAKGEPSLNVQDTTFLLNHFQQKAFLAFSGKGDFFAGYKPGEGFLEEILNRNVEIGLDINGVLIHEFPDLPDYLLHKIRYINLSLHFQQLKKLKLLNVWAENARVLIEKKGREMLLGTIISPPLKNLWEDSLLFYDREVFQKTGKRIFLIKDVNKPFSRADDARLATLERRFSGAVEGIHEEDFTKLFEPETSVMCPAGHAYFRIWNDGRVQGCPMIPNLVDMGNVKERRLLSMERSFQCSQPCYCDCNIIKGLGKMRRG